MQTSETTLHSENPELVSVPPVAANSSVPPAAAAPHAALADTGRRLRLSATIFVVALAAGFAFAHHIRGQNEAAVEMVAHENANALPAVEVVSVQKAPADASLTLPATTAAWYDSVIYARVDGYVGSWSADIGDHVKKGQILGTLEAPDLDAQLVAAQAKLKAADALVEFSKSTYERWKNSPKGVVSEQEREAKKADYDRAVAQAGLDQADVDRYTALAAFKQVTAPYDGTITERHIDIGNLVNAGSAANTRPLYHIIQDDPMRVFVDVPQSAATNIADGQIAHVTASNAPGHVFDGKVVRTADAISEQTRTLRVEIDIPNPDHALVSGMYVNASFDVPNDGLLQVPASALVFHGGAPQLAVVGDDGKVDFRDVTIVRDNGNSVEIGAGVTAGEKIALNIDSEIAQGEKVTVQNVSSGEAPHAAK